MSGQDYVISKKESYWSRVPSYELTDYVGESEDAVIPEEVSSIREDAFRHRKITSLTVHAKVSDYSITGLKPAPKLKSITFTAPGRVHCSLDSLLQAFPTLREINYPNAEEVSISCWRTREGELPMLRLLSPNLKKVSIRSDREFKMERLRFCAPWLSPGMMEKDARCGLIDTFLQHPDWYEDAARKKTEDWIRKNGDKFFPLCLEKQRQDLIDEFVFKRNWRFPAKTYDVLISEAEARGDTAARASYLGAKSKYYDLMELSRKKEAMEERDYENPLRVHAMQKIWSWSKMEDGSLCIKKLKNDAEELLGMSTVYVPQEIAGSPVTMVNGTVFRDAKVKEVVFPERVEMIRGKLFEGNEEIERVRFQGSIPFIPEGCFQNCEKLQSVELTRSGQWIGTAPAEKMPEPDPAEAPLLILSHAFEDSSVRDMSLRQAILSKESFYGADLRAMTLRDVRVIPERCFYRCGKLQKADIQGTVQIGFEGFEGCSSLTELHVSGHLVSLKQNVFFGCYQLKRVYIHNARYPAMVKKLFQSCHNYDEMEFIIVP